MDKLLEDMGFGYIKLLNLATLRNLSLEKENLIISRAKTCKIDKLIVMDETKLYVKEILKKCK